MMRQSLHATPPVLALLVVATVGVLGACALNGDDDAGNGVDPDPGFPDGPGWLSIYLTDDHTDKVSAVFVFIESLRVKPARDSVREVAREVGLIELLALRDRRELIARAGVEPGRYEFIEFRIDEARSSVIEQGAAQPLKTPSDRIKVVGSFEVKPAGQETRLTLDFDAEKSLVRRGNADWLLKPVVVIAAVE